MIPSNRVGESTCTGSPRVDSGRTACNASYNVEVNPSLTSPCRLAVNMSMWRALTIVLVPHKHITNLTILKTDQRDQYVNDPGKEGNARRARHPAQPPPFVARSHPAYASLRADEAGEDCEGDCDVGKEGPQGVEACAEDGERERDAGSKRRDKQKGDIRSTGKSDPVAHINQKDEVLLSSTDHGWYPITYGARLALSGTHQLRGSSGPESSSSTRR
ncbi:hypothetical protein BV22DRAFT_1052130 [Leucogyrophana mollusca]|uniref:Uncharacterized protein n=1 Tax=Leucogyrophana mollusca TaxID=85980 RepID=A0ACB8AZL6_9AGAM|nr:hypothetical protein BV22DRAFT_1052130 [Leucogyrophana mollusca]